MTDFLSLAELKPQQIKLADLKESLLPQSFGRPLDDLSASIKTWGLCQPLIVASDGKTIVSGWRRFLSLKELGLQQAPAIVLPVTDDLSNDSGKIYSLALFFNQPRGWNLTETALSWQKLHSVLGPHKALGPAAILNFDKAPKLQAQALKAASLDEQALLALAHDKLDLEGAAQIAAWSPTDRRALLELYENFAPSNQKRRQWQEWLLDLSRRENLAISEILQASEIQDYLAAREKLGRSQAENMARLYLWQRRHPQLAQLVSARQQHLKELNLPPQVKLVLDSNFEDLSFDLNIKFTDRAELVSAIKALNSLVANPHLGTLFTDDECGL